MISNSFPYIIVFSLLCLCSISLEKMQKSNISEKTKSYRVFCFILFVFIIMYFVGLRGFIFTDWIGYYRNYNNAPTLFDSFGMVGDFINSAPFERGYTLYVVILKTFFPNYVLFQLCDFILGFLLLWNFFKRYSRNIIFSYIFYFMFWGLMLDVNLQRNVKAILIVMNSIKFVEKKKIIPFILFIIIAMQFHISAIIYTSLYFLYPKEFNKKLLFVLGLALNFLYLAKIDLLSEFLILCSKTIVTGRFGMLLNRYVTHKIGFISTGITIGYLERLISFVLIFINYKRIVSFRKINIFFCNAFFVYYLASLFCASNLILFERVVPLFIFSYWILYPYLYKSFSLENKKVFLFLFVFYSILKLMATYRSYLCYYDNQLFLRFSAEQRLELFNKFGTVTSY